MCFSPTADSPMAPPTMRTNCAKSVQMTADNPPEVIPGVRPRPYYSTHITNMYLRGCIWWRCPGKREWRRWRRSTWFGFGWPPAGLAVPRTGQPEMDRSVFDSTFDLGRRRRRLGLFFIFISLLPTSYDLRFCCLCLRISVLLLELEH